MSNIGNPLFYIVLRGNFVSLFFVAVAFCLGDTPVTAQEVFLECCLRVTPSIAQKISQNVLEQCPNAKPTSSPLCYQMKGLYIFVFIYFYNSSPFYVQLFGLLMNFY